MIRAPLTMAAIVAGVALWSGRRKTPELGATTRRVLNRSRLGAVDARLLTLLGLWEAHGAHDVEIAPLGGRRTVADQARLHQDGATEASELHQSPHGYGLAIDVWPLGFASHAWSSTWERTPDALKAQFLAFGEFAEAAGFEWGGRWRGPKFPHGDQPHVQIPNWRSEVNRVG